jgi:hypothetical protein
LKLVTGTFDDSVQNAINDYGRVNTKVYFFLTSGSIEKGKLYRVHIYVKSNTGNNANGHVQIKINGETLIDQSILLKSEYKSNANKSFYFNHVE